MEEAIAWIGGHAPQGEAGVLIPRDFRLDNLIFDARAPRLAAILAWDISTLGHPLPALSFHLFAYLLPPHYPHRLSVISAAPRLPPAQGTTPLFAPPCVPGTARPHRA